MTESTQERATWTRWWIFRTPSTLLGEVQFALAVLVASTIAGFYGGQWFFTTGSAVAVGGLLRGWRLERRIRAEAGDP